MGALFSRPKAPPPPPPLPPLAAPTDEDERRRRAEELARRRRGLAATMHTSPRGLTAVRTDAGARKSLLGD